MGKQAWEACFDVEPSFLSPSCKQLCCRGLQVQGNADCSSAASKHSPAQRLAGGLGKGLQLDLALSRVQRLRLRGDHKRQLKVVHAQRRPASQ